MNEEKEETDRASVGRGGIVLLQKLFFFGVVPVLAGDLSEVEGNRHRGHLRRSELHHKH